MAIEMDGTKGLRRLIAVQEQQFDRMLGWQAYEAEQMIQAQEEQIDRWFERFDQRQKTQAENPLFLSDAWFEQAGKNISDWLDTITTNNQGEKEDEACEISSLINEIKEKQNAAAIRESKTSQEPRGSKGYIPGETACFNADKFWKRYFECVEARMDRTMKGES